MSHITRRLKGNRLEDWEESTRRCKAETCNVCMLHNLCINPKKKNKIKSKR